MDGGSAAEGRPPGPQAPLGGGRAASCAVAPGLSILGSGSRGGRPGRRPAALTTGLPREESAGRGGREAGARPPGAAEQLPAGPGGAEGRGRPLTVCLWRAALCYDYKFDFGTTSTRSLSLWSRELPQWMNLC